MAIELIKLANAGFPPTNLLSTFKRGLNYSVCPEKFSSSNSDFEQFQQCKSFSVLDVCARWDTLSPQ